MQVSYNNVILGVPTTESATIIPPSDDRFAPVLLVADKPITRRDWTLYHFSIVQCDPEELSLMVQWLGEEEATLKQSARVYLDGGVLLSANEILARVNAVAHKKVSRGVLNYLIHARGVGVKKNGRWHFMESDVPLLLPSSRAGRLRSATKAKKEVEYHNKTIERAKGVAGLLERRVGFDVIADALGITLPKAITRVNGIIAKKNLLPLVGITDPEGTVEFYKNLYAAII